MHFFRSVFFSGGGGVSDLTFSFLRKRRHDVIKFKEICLRTVASSFHKKKKRRKAITASSKLKREELKKGRRCVKIHRIHVPCWIWFSASPPRTSNALHSEGKWTTFSSIWNKFKRLPPARGKNIMLQITITHLSGKLVFACICFYDWG